MTLQAIAKVRRKGVKPGVVSVVIGPVPAWFDDDEGAIVVREGDTPEAMDWRPVIGVWVALFQTKQLPDLTIRTLDALKNAGAKCYGLADHTGTYPTVMNAGEEHHANLARTWRQLCRS